MASTARQRPRSADFGCGLGVLRPSAHRRRGAQSLMRCKRKLARFEDCAIHPRHPVSLSAACRLWFGLVRFVTHDHRFSPDTVRPGRATLPALAAAAGAEGLIFVNASGVALFTCFCRSACPGEPDLGERAVLRHKAYLAWLLVESASAGCFVGVGFLLWRCHRAPHVARCAA